MTRILLSAGGGAGFTDATSNSGRTSTACAYPGAQMLAQAKATTPATLRKSALMQSTLSYDAIAAGTVRKFRKLYNNLEGIYGRAPMRVTNKTILLLTSDPEVRHVMQDLLTREGYLVVAEGSLGGAVDRLKEIRPDLLIIRPYVNSMPGHDAAIYLRTKRPGIPVLMIGGLIDDDRLNHRNELEAFYIFPKPIPAREFVDEVKRVLNGTR
jgi:CheY-like chemotaxis protein